MLAPADEKNAFLSELSPAEYAALRSHLTPVELHVGQRLHYLSDVVEEVIFPNSGLIAMSMPLRDGREVPAALIGRDGIVVALPAIAGSPATYYAVVHVAGHASRLPAAAYRQLLEQNTSLVRSVARYAQALLAQSQRNAVCHAVHPVEARICRWLLAIQARCGGDKVPVIQDTLAQMLGVRRTTVTLVAGQLEAAGVLKCYRGYMHIIDQDGLERHSCECHAMLDSYLGKLLSARQLMPRGQRRSAAPSRRSSRAPLSS